MNAYEIQDLSRSLLIKIIPTLRRMLGNSGPWMDCPFCGSTDTFINKEFEWHSPTCPLRDAEALGRAWEENERG